MVFRGALTGRRQHPWADTPKAAEWLHLPQAYLGLCIHHVDVGNELCGEVQLSAQIRRPGRLVDPREYMTDLCGRAFQDHEINADTMHLAG